MSALAGCLLGLMVLCGEHAVEASHRGWVRGRLGPPGSGGGLAEATGRRGLPSWLPWVAPGAGIGWVVVRPLGALIGLCAALVARRVVRGRREAKLFATRDEQLADAVGSVAAALRAGLSVPQALSYAAGDTPAPLGPAFEEVTQGIDLGVPMETAVGRWAEEAGTGDARLLAGVLRLHRRSGGDLPAVLDQVGATLRDRRAAAQEVRALTAQARLSGAILGFLPIGFFAFLWLTSRSDIEGAFRTPAGILAIGVGLTLEVLAFLWIRHLLEVR